MWDTRSAIRERLYLLTRIGTSDPSPWTYDPVTDCWRNETQHIKVNAEAAESYAILKSRGLSEGAANALAHDGLGAGVQE